MEHRDVWDFGAKNIGFGSNIPDFPAKEIPPFVARHTRRREQQSG